MGKIICLIFVPTKTKFNLNINNMKKSKKQSTEDLIAISIAIITLCIIIGGSISIFQNL